MAKKVIVRDTMQSYYTYELVEPIGENFASDFTPELSPREMLSLGIFGGKYMTDCRDEFPKNWFKTAKLASGPADPALNYFQVSASQSLKEWQQKGWIYLEDPRGWFQWYCRYFMGRRIPDEDRRQINRWKAMKRHIGQVKAACNQGDLLCRPRQRQALLHWAYDSRNI